MKKVVDVFPIVDGLFSKMEYDFKFIGKDQLDILFISSYSQKTCSPLVDLVLTDIPVQSSQLTTLANTVLKVHKNKWDKHLNVYEIVYEPIYNYIDELNKTELIRRELMANVSHDLKTPLTMIKAYAELIKDVTYKNKEKTNKYGLTKRELEVLALIVEGLSNPEISDRLVVSLATTKAHVHSILQKLYVTNRTQATIQAVKEGLI
mgnify:CR=1 FL=1